MKKADPEGYYAALKLKPDASSTEIRLAWVMSKQTFAKEGKTPHPKVRKAYETLKNPELRRRYGSGGGRGASPHRRPGGRSRLDSKPLLLSSVAVLFVVLVWVFYPMLPENFTQYEIGDELYFTATEQRLGIIEQYTEKHTFPDGATMAAYRIRTGPDVEPKWYPAPDLNRHTAPR